MKINNIVYGIFYIQYIVEYKNRVDKLVCIVSETHKCMDSIRIIKTEYNCLSLIRKYLNKFISNINEWK